MPGTPDNVRVTYSAFARACAVHSSRCFNASRPIAAWTFGNRSVYCSGNGCSERILSQRNTSGFASINADTHSTGNNEIEKHPRLDEDALQPAHPQPIADPLL